MATLANTLRQNQQLVRGPGCQLSAQSTPGQQPNLQQLVGQAGLQAPPITPLGAAALGANADQQKMMGTPAQKEGALATAIQGNQPQQGLAGAVRQGQVRSQATGAEQQGIQKSTDMQNMGGLGDRVTDFINAQRQNLEQQAGTGVDVQAATGQFHGADLATVKDVLGQLRADPTNQDLMLQVNKTLGYDVNTQLDPTQIDQLYESASSAISRGGASDVADNLTTKDLLAQPGFGYDLNSLSNLLELPPDQISTMTVGQIRDQINKVGGDEFSTTAKLNQQAQSGLLGQAERGAAQQAGREASQTGVRASEANYKSLEDQIVNADQVTFAGKKYQVDDLLKDETVSGIISGLMAAGPDSDEWKQALKSEPQLMDFITKNQQVLADASTKLQGSAKQFQDTQTYNRNITTFGGHKLSDSLAALVPGYGQLSAKALDWKSSPLLYNLHNLDAQTASTVVDRLNTAAQTDPAVVNALAGLNIEQLAGLKIYSNDPNTGWNNYQKAKQENDAIQAIPDNNVDALVSSAFANTTGTGDLVTKLNRGKALGALGFSDAKMPNLAELTTDGQLDGAKLKSYLLENRPAPDLASIAQGNRISSGKITIPDPGALDPNSMQANIFQKLGDAAADGGVTGDEIRNAKLDLNELIYMKDNRKGNVDYNTVDYLWGQQRDTGTEVESNKVINDPNLDIATKISRLQQMRDNGDDNHVNKRLLNDKIAPLAQRLKQEQDIKSGTNRIDEARSRDNKVL